MYEHTYNGVPIAQVPTDELQRLLRDGIVVHIGDGQPDPEGRVIERIRIELLARSLEMK